MDQVLSDWSNDAKNIQIRGNIMIGLVGPGINLLATWLVTHEIA